MKTVTEQLTKYAAYHRDRRNIATHFIGIPMIVVAVTTLLGALHPYAAWAAAALACVYYFVLDWRLGLAMLAFNGAAVSLGLRLSLWHGLALFVVGWVFQFIGHWFEGKKPAFVDDLAGLIIGPLFVTAELGFLLGLRKPLRAGIEETVGPTRINPPRGAEPAAR